MERIIELMRVVRFSTTRQEDRTLILATLTEVAGLWQQTASLAAYQVIMAALDSNDDEVRRLAEESLNRSSPRPVNHGANSGGATSQTSTEEGASMMGSQAKTSVALMWHMHQPLYRDLSQPNPLGTYRFPWVRLHAIRDYFSMARLAERVPDLHLTINVTPCLLWQIEDYVERGATDRALALSTTPAQALNSEERDEVLATFFDADWHNEILIHERYGELLNLRSKGASFSPQDIRDLQMWFNLAWFGDEFRNADIPLPDGHVVSVHRYVTQQRGFSDADIQSVLEEQLRIMRAIVPYYKSLQEKGSIEISVTPFFHPILPLLMDTDKATIDRPGTSFPKRFSRPEDAEFQVRLAIEFYRERFVAPPRGMWPAEAAVSEAMLPVMARQDIRWIASDEGVLAKSGKWGYVASDPNVRCRAYQASTAEGNLSIFFRDAKLSNQIGFELQSTSEPRLAADELMHTLDLRVQGLREPGIVSIILDGENPWCAYPQNGRPFLRQLYSRLTGHDAYRTVTFSEYLDGNQDRAVPAHPTKSSERVYELFTGSWIDEPRSAPGVDLGTWIGKEEQNKGWELLGNVRDFVAGIGSRAPVADVVKQSLYAAEGSDWFWWFSDTQESGRDDEFDDLFRGHLKAVYRLLNQPVPLELSVPIVPRKLSWRLGAPIPTAFVGDRLSIQTNCPGTVSWWMSSGESGRITLRRAGGVLAGQSHHSAEVGPLGAGTLHFTIACSGCTCSKRCPCCTAEEHTVEVLQRSTQPGKGLVLPMSKHRASSQPHAKSRFKGNTKGENMPQQRKTTNRNVTFTCNAPSAQCVTIAGDFNQWDPVATPLSHVKNNTWQVRLPLTPGVHEFKYVVDGQWCCEPGMDDHCCEPKGETVDNAFGTKNLVMKVA